MQVGERHHQGVNSRRNREVEARVNGVGPVVAGTQLAARLVLHREQAVERRADPVGHDIEAQLGARLDQQPIAIFFVRSADPAIDDRGDGHLLQLVLAGRRFDNLRITVNQYRRVSGAQTGNGGNGNGGLREAG